MSETVKEEKNAVEGGQTGTKKVKIWNVPNIMTTFRVLLIIPFVIALLGAESGWFGEDDFIPCIVADVIFLVASITDLLDGKIARKYQLVTNFGKFMDPLADKMLVSAGLICLVSMTLVIMAIVDLSPYIPFYGILTTVVMYIALALTIISLVDYVVKNRKVILE